MSRFVLDPRAVEDLDDIWLYIAENASPSAADRVEARFFEIFHQLAKSPKIGHPGSGQERSRRWRPAPVGVLITLEKSGRGYSAEACAEPSRSP